MTMLPPLAFNSGKAARDRRMALFKLMSITSRKVSSSHSWSGRATPWQLTRTSRVEKVSMNRLMAAPSRTSSCAKRRPSPASARAASRRAAELPVATTLARPRQNPWRWQGRCRSCRRTPARLAGKEIGSVGGRGHFGLLQSDQGAQSRDHGLFADRHRFVVDDFAGPAGAPGDDGELLLARLCNTDLGEPVGRRTLRQKARTRSNSSSAPCSSNPASTPIATFSPWR